MFDLISKKKEYFILISIIVVFLIVRLPAIHRPYHQDEYKWPMYAYNIGYKPGDVPHPPLSEFIYRTTGKIFSENNFRYTPLVFSVADLILLYYFVKRRYGISPALWTIIFFNLSFYSVLASLTVDTDGAILPFFFLLTLLFYDLAYKHIGKKRLVFAGITVLCMILGLLVKMSSILGSAAIVLDFILNERKKFHIKHIVYFSLALLSFVGLSVLLLLVSQYVFPGFNLLKGISYWDTFVKGFSSRDFLQTGIQFIKSLFYLSPFLVGLGVISLRNYRKDIRLFHIFIAIGLIFYLVLFDFSIGALDRYFAFAIIPLCIIAGVLVNEKVRNLKSIKLPYMFFGVLILCIVNSLQYILQAVPPLHPKNEWVSRILSLKWNFLYPFFGGSGPLGFYISWSFIGVMWLLGLGLVIWYFLDTRKKSTILILFVVLGLVYNGVFIQEYLFGTVNGSAPRLVHDSATFIKNNPDIQYVTVYNDNGGWDVKMTGKYRKRLYIDPKFNVDDKIATLNKYKEHYLFIDIPRIDQNSVYQKYLDSCKIVFDEVDKSISAKIYDCRNAPDIKS